MSVFTQEELLQVARRFYPRGYPIETDDHSESLLAYQRTPEYARWEAAWDKAMSWEECDTLIHEVLAAFPTCHAGRFSQPRQASCIYCILSQAEPVGSGSRRNVRVVGALSVLAPIYLIYVLKEPPEGPSLLSRSQFSFIPADEDRPSAYKLARLIENHLGYRPFPLEWAEVPLPDIRVGYLSAKQPTLLTALFSDDLENLP